MDQGLVMKSYIIILLTMFLQASCGTAQHGKKKPEDKKPEENLSRHRPYFDGKISTPTPAKDSVRENIPPTEVKKDDTKKVNSVLDSIAKKNGGYKTVPGYRILIYMGRVREDAEEAKLKFYTEYGETLKTEGVKVSYFSLSSCL